MNDSVLDCMYYLACNYLAITQRIDIRDDADEGTVLVDDW